MRVVHFGGDLGADMALAHDARHHGFDAPAHAVFEVRGVLFRSSGGGVVAGQFLAARQQVAFVIDDGDAVRRQRGDGGGDQMLNGAHLFATEHAARLEHD